MRISLFLEAFDRMTRPLGTASRSVERLAKVANMTNSAIRRMGVTSANTTRRVGAGFMNMYDRARDSMAHLRRMMREDGVRGGLTRFIGEEQISRAGRSMQYFKGQVSGLSGGLTLLKYASVGAVIGLGEEFVRGVFKAGGETQQMLVTLTKLEGGAEKARKAMSWMQSFAMGAGASFSMPDIMRAYQMAQNFGMKPQGGSLASMADFAAGERVPLKQVLFAVKDAMEGTSTRPLANLGIKMMQGKGKSGTNSYLYADAAGKFITTKSAKNPEATLEAIMKIVNAKYLGLATAQAQTVPGGIEQMQKLLYIFQGKVATSGVFEWALKEMNRFFVFIRKEAANGDLDRLAQRIANFMTTAGTKIISFVSKTNWTAVGRDLSLVGGALMLIAKGLSMAAVAYPACSICSSRARSSGSLRLSSA